MVDVLYKVKDRLEECRSLLVYEMSFGSSKLTSDERELLGKVYNSICKTEDLFI